MLLQNLIDSTPFYLTTDQTRVVSSSSFPNKYINEEGKNIRIKAYFNGSIVKFKDKLLFCCRGDQEPWFHNIRLIFCELDDEFQPKKNTARYLEVGSNLTHKGDHGQFRVEDPRLFTCGGRLHLVYGDGYEVYHATFNDDLTIDKWKNITNFSIQIPGNDGREKNWCPFDYEGTPYFVYSDSPRVIWCPFRKQAIISEQHITWDYGTIRGGTPAIKYGNSYLAFFHSAKNIKPGDEWQGGRLYSMGAYVFEDKPPFRVTHITKVPIMRGDGYHKNPHHQGILEVVFPAGVAETYDSFFVSLGINDGCTGVIRVSKYLLQLLLSPLK